MIKIINSKNSVFACILFISMFLAIPGYAYIDVYIDPGHGGSDPGHVIESIVNYDEKHVNLQVALDVAAFIDADDNDCTYHLSRTDNETDIGLVARAYESMDLNAQSFVSIHHNSSPSITQQSQQHTVVLYSALEETDGDYPGQTRDTTSAMANKLGIRIDNAFGYGVSSDHPRETGAGFTVLSRTTMPSAITEASFICVAEEAWLLYQNTDNHRIDESYAIFSAWLSYYNGDQGIALVEYKYHADNPFEGHDVNIWEYYYGWNTRTTPYESVWGLGDLIGLEALNFEQDGYTYQFHHWEHRLWTFPNVVQEEHYNAYWEFNVTAEFFDNIHWYQAYFTGGPYYFTLQYPAATDTEIQNNGVLQIRWIAPPGIDRSSLMYIDYSFNDGASWTNLAGPVPFNLNNEGPNTITGYYDWDITGVNESNCRIRLRASDYVDNETELVSHSFSIDCHSSDVMFTAEPTSGRMPLIVDFYDESTHDPTSWTWDFGDGNYSNEQHPTHTYEQAGTFTVTLDVTNACGSTQLVKTDYITVTCDPPAFDFEADRVWGDSPLHVNFQDASVPWCQGIEYYWDFGDGATDNSGPWCQSSHDYTEPGVYSVTLTMTDECGQYTLTKTDYITVYDDDGVPCDGDNSGVVGDNPCNDATANCDDNCPSINNPNQEDYDDDGVGDACDNCLEVANSDQANSDEDELGNACDNCPTITNPNQQNSDTDEWGDVCDNCDYQNNSNQADDDVDGLGNACDNCTQYYNPDQSLPSNWTNTFGGEGIDMANASAPIQDTSFNNIQHTLTATITSPVKSATMDRDQTISWSLTIPQQNGSDCSGATHVCIKVNGQNEIILNCQATRQSQTGSLAVLKGDIVRAEVGVFDKGDWTKAEPAEAKFTYVEHVVDEITVKGLVVIGTTKPMTGQDSHIITVDQTDPPESVILEINQTISWNLHMPADGGTGCAGANSVRILKNTDVMAVLYCDSESQETSGSFSALAGDVITADCDGEINNPNKDRNPEASFTYYTSAPGDGDFYTLRLDACGGEVWSDIHSAGSDDEAVAAILTSSSDIVVAGTRNLDGDRDYYLIKYDSVGNVLWSNSYDDSQYDSTASIIEAPDGNYVVFGTSRYNNSYYYLFKVNADNGSQMWDYPYGMAGHDMVAADVLIKPSSGYICWGSAGSGTDDWSAYAVTADENGYPQATYYYTQRTFNDYCFSAVNAFDNGYALAGKTDENGNSDILIMKIDASYNLTWASTFGDFGHEAANDLLAESDGGFIVSGETNSYPSGSYDFYTLKASLSGHLLWSGVIGGSASDYGKTLVRLHNSGYAVAGNSYSYGNGFSDIHIVKFSDQPPYSPILSYPSDGGRTTDHTPLLRWNAVTGATSYIVVVDDTPDCKSPIYVSPEIPGTSWTSLYLGHNDYYWRVTALNEAGAGAFSEIRTFEIYHYNPDPSCPVLYVHDGNDFVEDNPLLTACEASGYKEVVTDYYLVQQSVAENNGVVKFQLRELEDEITYLNDIRLIAVDHPQSCQIAVSTNGDIMTYDQSLQPVSAVDHNDEDIIDLISTLDDIQYVSNEPGFILATFDNHLQNNATISLAALQKPSDCPIQREERDITKLTPDGSDDAVLLSRAWVEFLNEDGSWSTPTEIPLRQNSMSENITSELAALNQNQITIRISWNSYYAIDMLGQLNDVDQNVVSNVYLPYANILTKSNSNGIVHDPVYGDSNPLVMKKGDVYDFTFECNAPENPDHVRDYIIQATGRYEPDYRVYTDLIPNEFRLYDNYPNPFNPATTLMFDLPNPGNVKLEVFNIAGQKVKTLVNQYMSAGHKTVSWNGLSESGNPVASGIYFYRLQAGDFEQSKKMMLLK